MTQLIALSYSPWSEKARWALDHHGIDYKYSEHTPLIGELRLRVLLRRPTGLVTLPVLRDGGRFFTDSFDIAKHADRIGRGPRLFPGDKTGEIEAWNQRSEAAMAAGRAITVLRMADDPEMALAAIPPAVPAFLRPLLAPVARKGVDAFVRKYRMRDIIGESESVLGEALTAVEAALEGGNGGGKKSGYLLGGGLSYADIAMAVVLQGVRPVDPRYMATGPGGAKAWTNEGLARRYAGLLEWRDELYAKHRRPKRS